MDSQERFEAARKNVPEKIWEKWGPAAFRGYQPIPHDLFRFQAQLELSNSELVTLLNVLDFWWDANKAPFPGTGALAKRMNTDPRTIQRNLKSLHNKGYAVRERGEDEKRRFNLSGLRFRLTGLVLKEMGLPPYVDPHKVSQQVA